MKTSPLLLAISSLGLSAATSNAALTDQLVAYYNFESNIENQVSGLHDGAYGNGTANGAGAGFTGNAAFAGAEATSTTDRSGLLVGSALNLVRGDNAAASSGWFRVSTFTSSTTLSTTTAGSGFTLSSWFYLAQDPDTTAGRNYVFEGTNNFDVSFGTGTNGGTNYRSHVGQTQLTPDSTLSAGTWHNVVHVFAGDGTNTTLTVYLDGSEITTASNSVLSTAMDFTGLNFGTARDGQFRVFDGMLDEIAVWNRALTANEINNGNTGSGADSVYQRGLAGLAVPEPSTALLSALGALALLRPPPLIPGFAHHGLFRQKIPTGPPVSPENHLTEHHPSVHVTRTGIS
ncbi:MAG: LamG domain-containing protein [Verrucomicrobiota bacterium]